jgi:concanavalin A-like lectin/glucanase superfamily protein/uncharacterized protein DUF2341
MKRLAPWALLAAALGASCTLDLAGKPDESGGNGGATATAATGIGGSSATTSAGGAGGAGGSTASVSVSVSVSASVSVSVSVSASTSASVSSSAASSTGTGITDPVWTRLRELDLDMGMNGHVDDFAVLVLLNTSRIDYSATQDKGEDLRFTDLGDQPLPYEIERWDESGVSVVWVHVPALDQTGVNHTKIRMYYGNTAADDAQNAQGIWNATYAGVWHLSQDDNGLVDSTGKSPVAINHSSTRLASIVGDGRNFVAGTGQYIDTLNAAQIDRYTVEAWVKGNHDATTATGPNGALMREKNYQIMWDHVDPFVGAASLNTKDSNPVGSNWKAATFGPLKSNTWYYLAATFEGDKLRAFRDGAPTDMKTFATTDPQTETETAKIGRHAFGGASANFFDGMVDEVRISTKPRSDKWIQAQNRSMRDQGFVGFGPETLGSYALP